MPPAHKSKSPTVFKSAMLYDLMKTLTTAAFLFHYNYASSWDTDCLACTAQQDRVYQNVGKGNI